MKKIFTFFLALVCAQLASAQVTVSSVAEFNTTAVDASVTFSTPLIVLGQQGSYLLATDGTDNILIYGSVSSALNNGDTLLTVTGTTTDYKNQRELKSATYTVAGNGPAINPVAIDHVGADNKLCYAVLSNVTASVSNNAITFYMADGTVIDGYNSAKITLPANPASVLTYYGFVMQSDKKIQFIPFRWEGEEEPVVYTPVATIAEYLALADGVNFEFTAPLTVSFVYRIMYTCATYAQDATGGLQIYEKRANTNASYIVNYEQGDVIPAGWRGIKTDFNGTKEITPLDGFTPATEQGTIHYTERTFATLCDADVNDVVFIRNVTLEHNPQYTSANDISKHRTATDGTVEAFDFYDKFHSNEARTGYVLFPEEDGVYDIYGIGAQYYGAFEMNPFQFGGALPNPEPEPEPEPEAIHQNVKTDAPAMVLINGHLYINGYTLDGKRVR